MCCLKSLADRCQYSMEAPGQSPMNGMAPSDPVRTTIRSAFKIGPCSRALECLGPGLLVWLLNTLIALNLTFALSKW